ncbi:MAG: AAA family ATPase [Patescibacteria group bacterium]|nr:AAA family ATPase [Patescibacteria group bacterium]
MVKKNIWISDINVWSYGPLASINFNHIEPSLVLIYGPNEAGKTLLLESILKSILILSNEFKKNDRIKDNPNSKIVINKKFDEKLESFIFPERKSILNEVLEIEVENQSLERIFRNTFMIRNSDLKIAEEKGYFSTVSNIVMGWDYDDLESVKVEVRKLGRLNKGSSSMKSTLTNAGMNKIKKLRKDAVDFTKEISDYIKESKENEIESCEIKILETKKLIKRNKKRLEVLKNIEGKSKYEKTSKYLDKFNKTSQDLEPLQEFNIDSADKLKSINSKIDDYISRSNEIEMSFSVDIPDLKETEINQKEINEDLEKSEAEKTDFEILSKNLDDLRNFSENLKDIQNKEQFIKFSYIFAILALITLPGSIISLIFGFILLGLPFMIFGIIFGLMIFYDLRKYYKNLTLFRRFQTIINQSNKVGIQLVTDEELENAPDKIIDSVSDSTLKFWLEDIEKKIRRFYEHLDNLKLSLSGENSKIKVLQGKINDNKTKEEEYQQKLSSYQEEKRYLLDKLGILKDEDFYNKLEMRKNLEGKTEKYESHLQEFFGNETNTIEQWRSGIIDKYEKYKDLSVEAVDNFFEIHKEQEELHNLIEEKLPRQIEKWNKELTQHKMRLNSFHSSQNQLKLNEFKIIEEDLDVNTIYQLEVLYQKINDLITIIDNDKDLATIALEIFEEIEKEETERIVELFKNTNISNLFNNITNGRYIDVRFNDDFEKDRNYISVKKKDGQSFSSSLLSLGTNDQLLFSIRFALAEKMLKGNLGFFLFDDAFITSDPQRLKNQFEILKSFADKGWQIIYFSNKDEILKLFETNQIKSIYKLSQLE